MVGMVENPHHASLLAGTVLRLSREITNRRCRTNLSSQWEPVNHGTEGVTRTLAGFPTTPFPLFHPEKARCLHGVCVAFTCCPRRAFLFTIVNATAPIRQGRVA